MVIRHKVGDRSYIVRIGNRDVKRHIDDLIGDNRDIGIPAWKKTYGCPKMKMQEAASRQFQLNPAGIPNELGARSKDRCQIKREREGGPFTLTCIVLREERWVSEEGWGHKFRCKLCVCHFVFT